MPFEVGNKKPQPILIVDTSNSWHAEVANALALLQRAAPPLVVVGFDPGREEDITIGQLSEEMVRIRARLAAPPSLLLIKPPALERLVRRQREKRAFIRDLRRLRRGGRGWRRHVRHRKAAGTWRR